MDDTEFDSDDCLLAVLRKQELQSHDLAREFIMKYHE
jgi:hypothetical protein